MIYLLGTIEEEQCWLAPPSRFSRGDLTCCSASTPPHRSSDLGSRSPTGSLPSSLYIWPVRVFGAGLPVLSGCCASLVPRISPPIVPSMLESFVYIVTYVDLTLSPSRFLLHAETLALRCLLICRAFPVLYSVSHPLAPPLPYCPIFSCPVITPALIRYRCPITCL